MHSPLLFAGPNAPAHPRIVHQNVDPSPMFYSLTHCISNSLRWGGDVELEDKDACAVCCRVREERFESARVAGGGDDSVAPSKNAFGERKAEAFRGACGNREG